MTNNKLTEEEKVDTLHKIGVSSPYYALDNIQARGESVTAEITTEWPVVWEVGDMSLPEMGKHLAILGQCAIARQTNNLHYYAVTHGLLFPQRIPEGGIYFGKAKVVERRKSTADVDARLFDQRGELVLYCRFEYKILTTALMQRIYGDDPRMAYPDHGHFPGYPMKPMAEIGREVVDLVGHHYQKKIDFAEVVLSGYRLSPVADTITHTITKEDRHLRTVTVETTNHDGQRICSIDMTLR